jgi:hypothetical protein
MTIKLISILFYITTLGFFEGFGQSIASQAESRWGESIQDIRLSITVTNSVVQSGSSGNVIAVITNASKSTIKLLFTGTPADFDLILKNADGKLYHLIPQNVIESAIPINVDPGKCEITTLTVSFGKNIQPGDYILEATRVFFNVKDEHFELKSNILKVQVK